MAAPMILLQFIFQSGLITVVALYFIPIIHDIAYDFGIFANALPSTLALVDAAWQWSIIWFIAALAGNIVWMLKAIQREQVEQRSF
jgi:hypothetical protein